MFWYQNLPLNVCKTKIKQIKQLSVALLGFVFSGMTWGHQPVRRGGGGIGYISYLIPIRILWFSYHNLTLTISKCLCNEIFKQIISFFFGFEFLGRPVITSSYILSQRANATRGYFANSVRLVHIFTLMFL